MVSNRTVEKFIEKKSKWKEVLLDFRGILLNTELEETSVKSSVVFRVKVLSLQKLP